MCCMATTGIALFSSCLVRASVVVCSVHGHRTISTLHSAHGYRNTRLNQGLSAKSWLYTATALLSC